MANRAITAKLPYIGEFGLDVISEGKTDPRFAKTMTNWLFEPNDTVLRKRKGLALYSTIDASSTDDVRNLSSVRNDDNNAEYLVTVTNSTIYVFSCLLNSWSDMGGATTPTNDKAHKFVNYNGNIVGLEVGASSFYSTSNVATTNFADVTTSGAQQPVYGLDICSALGRLWVPDSNDNTLKYCDLLDHTTWGSAYNLSSYWDEARAVGITQYGNYLIVFGTNNILVYNTNLGADNLILEKVIKNVGCVSELGYAHVNGDVWFASKQGIQSLRALLQDNPEGSYISRRAFNSFTGLLYTGKAEVSIAFHQTFNWVIVLNTTDIWIIDLNKPLSDGTFRIFKWFYEDASSNYLRCVAVTETKPTSYPEEQAIFFGANNGKFFNYDTSTNYDDTNSGSDFDIAPDLKSTNIDLNSLDPELADKTKILKQWGFKYEVDTPHSTDKSLILKSFIDYNGEKKTQTETKSFTATETGTKKMNISYSSDVFSLEIYDAAANLSADQFTIYDFFVTFTVGKPLGYS